MQSPNNTLLHGNRHSSTRIVPLLLTGCFVLFSLWLGWVGWLDSDDRRHVEGGLGWFREFPYLPRSHGEFRHLITIPLGLTFRLFGVSEWSLVLPNLMYFAGVLLLTYLWVGRFFGRGVSILAILIIASVPVFVIQTTVVFSDITELFFVALSMWLFLAARDRTDGVGLLVLSGMAVGCAWLTRETTIALIITYGILFLAGQVMPRQRYFLLGVGFAIVVIAEAALMYYLTGNPLYRYQEILSARQEFGYRGPIEGELFDGNGNIHVSRLLDPVLALFVNHESGIIYFVFIPAAIWLWRNPPLSGEMLRVARVWSLLAGVWLIAVPIMLTNMHPRYFTVATYVAAIICAIWIVYGVLPQRRWLAGVLSVSLLASGFLAIYVDNRNPLFGERALKVLLLTQPGIVHTDPETARRSKFLLQLDDLDKRVSPEAPAPGALYYYNPNRERFIRKSGLDPKEFVPPPGWTKVWELEEPPRVLGTILQKASLAEWIHPSLYRRFSQPNRPVAAYRVTD